MWSSFQAHIVLVEEEEQARKSSEDTQAAGQARFEPGKLYVKNNWAQKSLVMVATSLVIVANSQVMVACSLLMVATQTQNWKPIKVRFVQLLT